MRRLVIVSATLLLLCACGPIPSSKAEKPALTAEEHAHVLLKDYAANAKQCSKEMLDLIEKEGSSVKSLILSTKKLVNGMSTGSLADSIGKPGFEQMRKNMFMILTSDDFVTVLNQTSDLVSTVANNETVLKNTVAIHQALQKEDGDRLAEIVSLAASDPSKLQTFLEAGRTWVCSDYSHGDLLGFIYAPKTLWDLGGVELASDVIYWMGYGQFVPNSLELQKTLLQFEIPPKLKRFVDLMKQLMPKNQGLCQMENLDAYKAYFPLLVDLFKTPEAQGTARPLRATLNLLSKLHTMNDANQCIGFSFDALQKEDFKSFLIKTSNFIKDNQAGIVGILQKAKPRGGISQ